MARPIEFYFDFSSPYGYLAAQRIDEIAERHGRQVAWKPFLLGVTFKATGLGPMAEIPIKGDYFRHDVPRSARLLDVPVQVPDPFPFMSVSAARAVYWLSDRDEPRSRAFAKRLYQIAFGEGRDISRPESVVAAAADFGLEREAVSEALRDPAVKDRLRREVDAGIEKGVFGSPYIFVDDEPFWGHDRLDQVERWLETGGW